MSAVLSTAYGLAKHKWDGGLNSQSGDGGVTIRWVSFSYVDPVLTELPVAREGVNCEAVGSSWYSEGDPGEDSLVAVKKLKSTEDLMLIVH